MGTLSGEATLAISYVTPYSDHFKSYRKKFAPVGDNFLFDSLFRWVPTLKERICSCHSKFFPFKIRIHYLLLSEQILSF